MKDLHEHCKYCINRNKVKLAFYNLVQQIEKLPGSTDQTDTVVMSEEVEKLVLKEHGNKFDCQNLKCELMKNKD